jgi:hypothetical protein
MKIYLKISHQAKFELHFFIKTKYTVNSTEMCNKLYKVNLKLYKFFTQQNLNLRI